MSVQRALGAAVTPNFMLEDIQRMTQSQKESGGFRRTLGGIVGGVGNMFFPGIGSAIGNMIAGGRMNSTGMLGESQQFLELQRQVTMETRAFEAASAVMKARHDAAMSAIRNMK
ncbi:MAG: hypothetical protein R2729_28000 [Bryobacteraceae bacterium]